MYIFHLAEISFFNLLTTSRRVFRITFLRFVNCGGICVIAAQVNKLATNLIKWRNAYKC